MSVVIIKTSGGLGRKNPSQDMVSGLITTGVAVTGGAQLATTYRLGSVQDAESIGLDSDYDEANLVLVYEHIKEFFRINPDGDLYLRIEAQTNNLTNLVDVNLPFAKQLLADAEGEIRQLAVAICPTNYTGATAATITAAIPAAQLLADYQEEKHAPVNIILEGRGFDSLSVTDVAARSLNSKDVSVVVGQSISVQSKQIGADSPYVQYAAAGTCLGALSAASVNESIGWVEKFNLLGGSLDVPGVSGNTMASLADSVIDEMDENGLIYLKNYIGYPGVYFSASHTSTVITSDFATIENRRVIHKAHRLVRTALLPSVNSPVKVDPNSGQLAPSVIKRFEAIGLNSLETMVSADEVSAVDVYVDPFQNILESGNLEVRFAITPTGTANKITGIIGFENPFN